MKGFI